MTLISYYHTAIGLDNRSFQTDHSFCRVLAYDKRPHDNDYKYMSAQCWHTMRPSIRLALRTSNSWL